MKLLRTLSTRSLVLLAVTVVALAAASAAIAIAATKSSGPTPPSKDLDAAIHDALTAQQPDGVTARIKFTNRLFPSGALLGQAGSALMSGASGRLWLTNDGRGRLELQSDAGDAQVVWSDTRVTVYDASSNTVYRADLPAQTSSTQTQAQHAPPTLAEIQDFLKNLAQEADVSGAKPTDVAGQPTYTVRLAPKHDGGLLGAGELAWDAVNGVPLRAAIYAQGDSNPVLELEATDVSYGPVSSSDVEVTAPSSAKTVDVTPPAGQDAGAKDATPVTGLDAVKTAAGFPVAAPDTLVGLPRQDVRLVGGSDSKAALVVYGQGLGAIVVVERKADTSAGSSGNNDPLSSLPKISLNGVTGHELATQLGTALTWSRGGVDYVLAGSLPAAAAETAARDIG